VSRLPSRSPSAARRRAAAPPRVVLFWIVVIIAVAIGLYAIAPWILPVRIIEGPLVQLPAPDGVTLVWFTSRPAECTLEVQFADEVRPVSVTADGRRHEARVTGLEPDHPYPYHIRTGSRSLSDEGIRFETPRRPDQRFAFVVFGDSGKGSQAQYLLAAEMNRFQPLPDFLLHTGDVVYPDGARRDYEAKFFAPYRHLISRVAFWPCLGNHDVDDDGAALPYQRVFTLPDNGPPETPPEHNYWFEYANCRVVVLDSNADTHTLADRIAPWAAEVLARPGVAWRFVSLHHPPYNAGKYQPDARIQEQLVPVFERTGVDIVFAGHDHNYQRLGPLRGGTPADWPDGVLYIITGAGGAHLYAPEQPAPEYLRASDFEQHSYTHVVVEGRTLTLRQINRAGDVLDEVQLEKAESAAVSATQPATAPAAP
jgi:hypothetical protein